MLAKVASTIQNIIYSTDIDQEPQLDPSNAQALQNIAPLETTPGREI